jgi:hypothetical protein
MTTHDTYRKERKKNELTCLLEYKMRIFPSYIIRKMWRALKLNTFCTGIFPLTDHCEGGEGGRIFAGPSNMRVNTRRNKTVTPSILSLWPHFYRQEPRNSTQNREQEKLFDLKSMSVLNSESCRGSTGQEGVNWNWHLHGVSVHARQSGPQKKHGTTLQVIMYL